MKNTVRLRPIEERDVDFLYSSNNRNFMGDWQCVKYVSHASYKKRYSEGGFNNDKMQVFVIEKNERRVGFLIADFISEYVVNIGVALDVVARGRGVCKAVLSLIVDHIFSNYIVERIEADTDAENESALMVLESFGFVREGVLRHRRFHHGIFHDSVFYSILRKDWTHR